MQYYAHSPGDLAGHTKRCELPAVYVLATPGFKFIKIGKSNTLKKRIQGIQSGCPFDLELWQTIRTPLPDAVEKCLHNLMAGSRARGEWFAPTDADLDLIDDFVRRTNASVREAFYGR
jgi:hypothetical protein